MEKEILVLLNAELAAQVREIENIYAKLEERRRKRGAVQSPFKGEREG